MYYSLLQSNSGGVEAKKFVLHLGITDEWSQWCNRLPLGKGGSVVRRILLVLAAAAVMVTSIVPAVAVTMVPAVAVMMVVAEPAQAKHGGLHRPQPSRPPGNSDSDIDTGRGNRTHACRGATRL